MRMFKRKQRCFCFGLVQFHFHSIPNSALVLSDSDLLCCQFITIFQTCYVKFCGCAENYLTFIDVKYYNLAILMIYESY